MHRFVDFKSFKDASINLLRPLTILIGPNGSGKSNSLEAIQVLSSIAEGHRLQEITDLEREGSLNVRGGLQGCTRHGADEFTLEFWAYMRWPKQSLSRFDYRVTVRPSPEPRITSESLFAGNTLLFETIAGSGSPSSADLRVRYNNFARGGQKPQVAVSATRSLLSQYEHFATRNQKRRVSLTLIEAVRNHLRASFMFDPDPRAMRRYERVGHDELLRDGSNLSSVLLGLRDGGDAGNQVLDWLFTQTRQVPDEPYESFDFVVTELGDVMFGMREEHSGELADARLLSDGTLRTLAVLTAVATAEAGSRVVVEEFDNGLHPSRVAALVNAISEVSERRSINVLVSTHNPETLNSLGPKQQRDVVFAFRAKDDMCSRFVSLEELPRHDELLDRGRLGDLVTRRIIDDYLRTNVEEERSDAIERWIAGLD